MGEPGSVAALTVRAARSYFAGLCNLRRRATMKVCFVSAPLRFAGPPPRF
jgi:hypothetical protein